MYGRYPYQGQIPPPPQGGQGLTSNPGGFGQGVMQFIQSYRGEAAAKKENAAKMFEKHAAMLAQGLPVDKKKMAKWAREADLHFDLDPPPPPPAQPPMPQAQGAAPGAAPTGFPGMPPGMPGEMQNLPYRLGQGPPEMQRLPYVPGSGRDAMTPLSARAGQAPPPPAAMAGQQNFERGLPQRQSAEQAYMAANGGPSMAARAGMQNFQQGMPQRQAAEQAYMQANPRQPGFLKRLISGIGEATGVPQPPTQAQQMGVMKMLQEIEQRGQSSREMAGMQEKLKRRGMEIAVRLDEMLGKGKTLEDPEVMQLIAQGQMLGGLTGGGQMNEGVSKLLGGALGDTLLPNAAKKAREADAAQAEQKQNESILRMLAPKHDNLTGSDLKAALGGDFSALDESIGADKTAKMAKDALELKSLYKNEKAVNAYTTALYGGASFEELQPLMEALGRPVKETQEEQKIAISAQNANTSATNAQTAISRVNQLDKRAVADTVTKAMSDASNDKETAKEALQKKLSGLELLTALDMLSKYRSSGSDSGEFGREFGKALAEGLR